MIPRGRYFRAVPRASDPIARLRTGAKDLGLFLATTVPRSPELLEEIAYDDLTDGSLISLRCDRITNTPQILTVGPRAEELHAWAIEHLHCWTAAELLEEATIQLEGADIDGIVDAAVVLFMCVPPSAELERPWADLVWRCLEHSDADVRHAAVAGTFFRLWEYPKVRAKIESIARADVSEAVRKRARAMCKGWGSQPPVS